MQFADTGYNRVLDGVMKLHKNADLLGGGQVITEVTRVPRLL
jgi:hypothetical protein